MGLRLRAVEGVGVIGEAFEGRSALVTGHTGFKGSWLAHWLTVAGARVVGYALAPYTEDDNFVVSGIGDGLAASVIADVRDPVALGEVFAEHRPEVVFHLAAQPLVRYSYENPAETFHVNVVGAANVLDAVRATDSVAATVVITSDKCYRNNEWWWGYREADTLGGHDPYSASKAAEEMVVGCYRDSYFDPAGRPLASTRAGNVIGGGDWAEHRIVPDAARALRAGVPVAVRNPSSTRPWQHVLEPLGGYLLLAQRMLADPGSHADAYNFGPDASAVVTVGELVEEIVARWGGGAWEHAGGEGSVHEAGLLSLDCSKARHELGWTPLLSWREAVAWTVEWYRAHADGSDPRKVAEAQIAEYEERASAAWRPPRGE